MDDYLTKPFDPEELKARLRTGKRILDLGDRLIEAREEMRFQATHDALTSLWNRGVVMELLGRELTRSRRENKCTAILLGDLDHFKNVNDTYGHLAGDEVLKETSRQLVSSVRSYDFVGRFGGEEFLVTLNNCDPAFGLSASRKDSQNHRRPPGGDFGWRCTDFNEFWTIAEPGMELSVGRGAAPRGRHGPLRCKCGGEKLRQTGRSEGSDRRRAGARPRTCLAKTIALQWLNNLGF